MNVVFQCRQCDAILGDTSDWLRSVGEADLIALGDMTDGSLYASEESVQVTSKFRIDNGAVYRTLCCVKCDAKVGLYYVDTGKFDPTLKNAYLLELGAIKAYQIGGLPQPQNKVGPLVVPLESNKFSAN